MHDNSIFAGIDVAKNHLDVCILPFNKTKRFKNTSPDIEKMIQFIASFGQPERIVLEPTGSYEELVTNTLAEKGFKVSKINAAQIRSFARASGTLSKTDKIDAHVLAEYGAKMPCRLYAAPTTVIKTVKKLTARRKQLVHMIVEEKNRLRKETDEEMISLIKIILSSLGEQKILVEGRLLEIVKSDGELKRKAEVLTSLKGIGIITAIILLAELPELGRISKNQVSKLVGVAPLNRDSGQMRGKAQIYGGRGSVRDSLYLCALPAIRFEPRLKAFYNKLKQKGKPGKLAVIAVAHKMIIILNARMKEFYA